MGVYERFFVYRVVVYGGYVYRVGVIVDVVLDRVVVVLVEFYYGRFYVLVVSEVEDVYFVDLGFGRVELVRG